MQMKFATCALLLSVLILSVSGQSGDVDESDVLVLTPANFDDTIAKHSKILVEFYAPWCGHCKQLTPHYAKAATKLKAVEPEARLAKVDADAHKELGEKFGVQGFPTLKWFVDGTPSDFGGGRTDDAIVSWVKKKMGPAAKPLAAAKDFDDFKETADDVDHADAATFKKVADAIDDVSFAIALKDTHSHAGHKHKEIILYKKFDEGKAVYDGEMDKDKVKDWIGVNQLAYVTEFSPEASGKIFGSPIKTQALFFGDKEEDDHVKAKKGFDAVAKEYYGKVVAVSVPADQSNVLDYFGVRQKDLPCMFVVKAPEGQGQMQKFKGPGSEELAGGSEAALKKFLSDYFEGKVESHKKSEEVPEEPVDKNGVTTLVGKTFDEVVNDPALDVLVEFYAPWCGHCKQLAPIYDKLGKEFREVDTVVIAKMDATANDAPESAGVKGFPTLKFYKSGTKDKTPIDFDGERTVKGFKKFLKKNVGTPYELKKADKKKKKKDGDDDAEKKEEL